jgi:CHAD domain-containing protein
MDAGYLALAAKYVRRQAKQLADQLDGICRAEDIEYVHRARVASRRLRAALRMFRDCFGAKAVKRWRNAIRQLASDLGDARDKDVQIVFLCGVMDAVKDPACYPGVARLMVQLERQREKLQFKVLAAVKHLRASGVLEDMETKAKRIWSDLMAAEFDSRSAFAREQTGKYIRRRLRRLLAQEESLHNPEDVKGHHAMRIAAKRLRYTLEITKPVHGEEIQAAIDAVKKVQSLLGDIHDCDVWIEQLAEFLAAERKALHERFGNDAPLARLAVGIEHLEQDRRKHRREAFLELVEYWDELQREQTWIKLARIVGIDAAEPAEETMKKDHKGAAEKQEEKSFPTPAEDSRVTAVEQNPAAALEPTLPAAHWNNSHHGEIREALHR